ncbi:Proteasome subunit beta [Mycena sanguinolenta]|uniref:Proteasome subunit beta n=1 Tax=Mycena sanguinolenta TaxID=230812 RepID=A0A8H6YAG7_9AGAR|nr:Proteasome subunit beta [Mycena sanguinolenta]
MDRIDFQQLKAGEVNLGTSIMAVQFSNGVVIGADSRTTTGSYIANRVTDKLTHVHDRVYCCRSGSAADTQAVADMVHYYCQILSQSTGSPPTVHAAANIFQKICYENKDALSAGIIVAGWDKDVGPSVYNIPLGGGLFRQPWAIGGSGSTYVYGYCDATYQEGWGRGETIEFVKKTLSLAMARDGSSGGVIRMCVITEEGVERLFIPGNELPQFWTGIEVLAPPKEKVVLDPQVAPMVVE